MEPRIQYAKTEDGVSIAFTVLGSGSEVLVSAPTLYGDLHRYQAMPRFQTWFDELANRGRQVVLYDSRNAGSSEHRDTNYSNRALLADLEAVVDHLGLGQFSLYGMLHGCPAATAYAVANPDRVTHLVLNSPFARGADLYTAVPEMATIARMAAATMTAEEEDIYYQSAAGIVGAFGDPERAARNADMMRTSMSVSEVTAYREAMRDTEITDLLRRVSVPTLVAFSRSNMPALLPLAREVARLIPGAEFLDKRNQGRQAYDPGFLDAVDAFICGEQVVDTVESAPATPSLPSATAVILFLDIAGSTALTTKLGDAAYRERERDLDASLRSAITEAGGTPLEGKLLGDGILSVYVSAKQAIDAAQRCRDIGNQAGLPLHLGIHAGDVIHEENDVRGGAVQVAARVQAVADPGEILVSATVRDLARTSAGVAFEDRGEHELKGIPEPQRLFAVKENEG